MTHTLKTEGSDASEDGTGRGVPIVAQTLNANYGRTTDAAGSHGKGPVNIIMAPAFSKRPGQQIATREDGLSYALTGGEPPRLATSTVRRLTPVECERLQGFPDDWTQGESDSARYRMLGNAVAVPVAEWIGARLLSLKASTP